MGKGNKENIIDIKKLMIYVIIVTIMGMIGGSFGEKIGINSVLGAGFGSLIGGIISYFTIGINFIKAPKQS